MNRLNEIRARCEAAAQMVVAMRVCNSRDESWPGCRTGQEDCPYGATVMDCTERLSDDVIDFIDYAREELLALSGNVASRNITIKRLRSERQDLIRAIQDLRKGNKRLQARAEAMETELATRKEPCEFCCDQGTCMPLDWQYGLDHVFPKYSFCPMCGRKLED